MYITPLCTWSYQILFSPIDGHELLIILQLSCCSKVCQLVNRLPVLPDLPHDVARLDVPVDHSIFTQVVHPLHWGEQREEYFQQQVHETIQQHQIQPPTYTLQHSEELGFWQAKGVFSLLQQAEQTPSGAILHHQHLLLRGQLAREGSKEVRCTCIVRV